MILIVLGVAHPPARRHVPRGMRTRSYSTAVAITAGLLAVVTSTSCTEDKLRPSVAEDIIGEYYLAQRSGGIAGTTEVFAPTVAPITVRFDDEGGYRYVSRVSGTQPPIRDTTYGQWFMTDISRLGVDTFVFRFTDQLTGVFAEAQTRLEARDRLLVEDGFPDGLEYVFLRSE